MKFSITGGSGHIGANLCRTLISSGHSVKVLINRYRRSLEGLKIEEVSGNLLNMKALSELVKDADVVIHLAASISIDGQKNKDLLSVNVEGTMNLLKAIQSSKVKRLIHFSSIHALTRIPLDDSLDESHPLAINDSIMYNRSKARSEQLILEAVDNGLDAVILNPTAVIGPYDYKPSLMGHAIIQIYSGKIPALIPGGYNWVDVRDVVQATLSAVTKGRPGERYLLPGHWLSIKKMADMIYDKKGKTNQLRTLPFWLARAGLPFLTMYARITGSTPLYTQESIEILKTSHRNISNEKARRELDYNPRPIGETINDTLEWFGENNYI